MPAPRLHRRRRGGRSCGVLGPRYNPDRNNLKRAFTRSTQTCFTSDVSVNALQGPLTGGQRTHPLPGVAPASWHAWAARPAGCRGSRHPGRRRPLPGPGGWSLWRWPGSGRQPAPRWPAGRGHIRGWNRLRAAGAGQAQGRAGTGTGQAGRAGATGRHTAPAGWLDGACPTCGRSARAQRWCPRPGPPRQMLPQAQMPGSA
jgi:hypothetical protein